MYKGLTGRDRTNRAGKNGLRLVGSEEYSPAQVVCTPIIPLGTHPKPSDRTNTLVGAMTRGFSEGKSMRGVFVVLTAIIFATPAWSEPRTKWNEGVFEISAYCPCQVCCGHTHGMTRSKVKAFAGVVAVDPGVIPLGTAVLVEGFRHPFIAADTGDHIKGRRLDIFFESHQKAVEWGRQFRTVRWLAPQRPPLISAVEALEGALGLACSAAIRVVTLPLLPSEPAPNPGATARRH